MYTEEELMEMSTDELLDEKEALESKEREITVIDNSLDVELSDIQDNLALVYKALESKA